MSVHTVSTQYSTTELIDLLGGGVVVVGGGVRSSAD